MIYYISGIGFVTPEFSGCGRQFRTFDCKLGKLNPISRKDVLDKPYKPFGRMDFFSKIGFAGVYFACKDANLINNNKTSNASIIATTVFGCLETDNNYFNTIKFENGKNASPAIFAYTLPNIFLGESSIYLGLTGETFVINSDTVNGTAGLKMAFDILDSEESDFVVCGLCDTNIPEFLKQKEHLFAGSLFFTISKEKSDFCYGPVKKDTEDNIYFNDKNTDNLIDLARVCIESNGN
ncbi:MAG: hypothetical protein GY749_11850 [Desulfobacteraceae bacterium]|nr:hypothetical protein [Desulfobacteraceae bacterium]